MFLFGSAGLGLVGPRGGPGGGPIKFLMGLGVGFTSIFLNVGGGGGGGAMMFFDGGGRGGG